MNRLKVVTRTESLVIEKNSVPLQRIPGSGNRRSHPTRARTPLFENNSAGHG